MEPGKEIQCKLTMQSVTYLRVDAFYTLEGCGLILLVDFLMKRDELFLGQGNPYI